MLYLEWYEADGEEAIETHVIDRGKNGNIRERVKHVLIFLGSWRPEAQICAASKMGLWLLFSAAFNAILDPLCTA